MLHAFYTASMGKTTKLLDSYILLLMASDLIFTPIKEAYSRPIVISPGDVISIKRRRQPKTRLTLNSRCQMDLDIQIQSDVDPQTAFLLLVLPTTRLVFGSSVRKLIGKGLTSRLERTQSLICGTLSSIASPTQGTLGGISDILGRPGSFLDRKTLLAAALGLLLLSLGLWLRFFLGLLVGIVVILSLIFIIARVLFIFKRSRGSLVLLLLSVRMVSDQVRAK